MPIALHSRRRHSARLATPAWRRCTWAGQRRLKPSRLLPLKGRRALRAPPQEAAHQNRQCEPAPGTPAQWGGAARRQVRAESRAWERPGASAAAQPRPHALRELPRTPPDEPQPAASSRARAPSSWACQTACPPPPACTRHPCPPAPGQTRRAGRPATPSSRCGALRGRVGGSVKEGQQRRRRRGGVGWGCGPKSAERQRGPPCRAARVQQPGPADRAAQGQPAGGRSLGQAHVKQM